MNVTSTGFCHFPIWKAIKVLGRILQVFLFTEEFVIINFNNLDILFEMGLQLSSLLFDAGEGFFSIQYSIFYFDEIIWFSCFIVVGTYFRCRATQNTLLTLGALLLWDLRSFLIGFLTTLFLDINASIKAIIRAIFEILIFRREMTHGHI